MKTLKLSFLTLCLMLGYNLTYAEQPISKPEKFTSNYTLKAYVDAIFYGKVKGVAQIIDDDAKFTIQRGETIIIQNKAQILQAMKRLENVQQDCEITQSIVQMLPNQIIAKIDMKYQAFTRSNFVTLSESGAGWKVSRVASTFK